MTSDTQSDEPAVLHSIGRRVHRALEGDSIVATLTTLREDHDRLEVSAIGHVDAVRLDGAAPRVGKHLVVSLTGNVTAKASTLALICRAPDGELVAGLLDDARAIDLELSVELFDEAPFEQKLKAERVPTKSLRSAKSLTWAEVAAASASTEPEVESTSTVPQLGDVIEHATFGTCSVAKVDEDDDVVMVRTPGNRVLRLSLEVLRLELLGTDENGRTTFRARGGPKK